MCSLDNSSFCLKDEGHVPATENLWAADWFPIKDCLFPGKGTWVLTDYILVRPTFL